MPPKSILKKKTAPGRTATGKRARPGQNIRNAAKAEAESLKAKTKKGPNGRPLRAGKPGPGPGEVPKTGAASATGSNMLAKGKGKPGLGSKGTGSKGSVSAQVKKSGAGGDKGKKRAPKVDEDSEDGSGEELENGFGSDDDMEGSGAGTDDEIDRLNGPKPKSSSNKRKRPTTATEFGSTLTSLLGDIPAEVQKPNPKTKALPKSNKTISQQPILALSRNRLPPSRSKLALERRAEEAVKKAKVERVERARVTDVMEGWGQPGGSQEFERGLRKVAQRGVIKLFNAILSASKAAEEGQSTAEQAGWKDEKIKRKEKDNILGRGGKEALTKEGFLDMVRKG